jgi:hypothetical protein
MFLKPCAGAHRFLGIGVVSSGAPLGNEVETAVIGIAIGKSMVLVNVRKPLFDDIQILEDLIFTWKN